MTMNEKAARIAAAIINIGIIIVEAKEDGR